MSIITIALAGKNFSLSCPEESRSQIEKLAEKLDFEIKKTSKANPSASFEMLLVMVSLGLIDDKYSESKNSDQEILETVKKEHDKQLQTIFDELKLIANKLEKC